MSTKKPYTAPSLIVYGKVLDLTNGASLGSNDPGGAQNAKSLTPK